jgi:hypothetical protein
MVTHSPLSRIDEDTSSPHRFVIAYGCEGSAAARRRPSLGLWTAIEDTNTARDAPRERAASNTRAVAATDRLMWAGSE